jgi:hypothetical protein
LTTPTVITPRSRCVSTPIPRHYNHSSNNSTRYYSRQQTEEPAEAEDEDITNNNPIGKPRSRFSEYEDNIIKNGVAQRLTWGQISDLLPHRKRATCFNRYRTLQGIRKSRKQSSASSDSTTSPVMTTSSSSSSASSTTSNSPISPVTSTFSTGPTTPPSHQRYSNYYTSASSADIIYPIPIKKEYNYCTSAEEQRQQLIYSPPTTKRAHRISLPASASHYHRRM